MGLGARGGFGVGHFRRGGLLGVLDRLDRDLRGSLGLLGQRRKCRRAGNGQLRQALAVERDPGVLQPADHLPVREPVLAGGRVDADYPQAAEITLLAAAADESVLERRVDRFFRGAIQLALIGVKALGELQQFLALGPPDGSSFYTRHSLLPNPYALIPICTAACVRSS